MKETDFKNLEFSVLGTNSNIEGDLKFSGDTLINCDFKGSLTITGKGKLTIERFSNFEGKIYCNDLEVFGKVQGTINASGNLSIRSSAEISGLVSAKKMSVSPGAHLNIEGHTSES